MLVRATTWMRVSNLCANRASSWISRIPKYKTAKARGNRLWSILRPSRNCKSSVSNRISHIKLTIAMATRVLVLSSPSFSFRLSVLLSFCMELGFKTLSTILFQNFSSAISNSPSSLTSIDDFVLIILISPIKENIAE